MRAYHADTLRFDLPESWDEITFGQALQIVEGVTVTQALCILSGLTEADFRPLRAPDLAGIVRDHLSFLGTPPEFKGLPVPTTLTIGGKTITPPTNIGSQTTIGQKWDIDSELQAIGEDDETDLFAVAPTLLSIYLAPLVTGQPYTDIEQAHSVLPTLRALPCTQLLPLAAFFLSSCRQTTPSGRVSSTRVAPATTPRRRWPQISRPAWVRSIRISLFWR